MAKFSGAIYRKGIQRCVDVPKAALPRGLRSETRSPVIVKMGKLSFESTLLPRSAEHFQLVVPMPVLRKMHRDWGNEVEFERQHEPAREAPPLPDELVVVLHVHPGARQIFLGLTVAMQRQIVRFVDAARSDSVRRARAEKVPSLLPRPTA